MKKLISILFVIMFSITLITAMTSVCLAENNTSLYIEKLAGTTWKIIRNESNKDARGETITFEKDLEIGVEPFDYLNKSIISGDETGAVYLSYSGTFSIQGKITFTQDEKTMIICVDDIPSIILSKQN